MRHILIGVALGGTLAAITSPVRAQVPFPPAPPPQWQDYFNNVANWPYPFPALTPWDAYRQGLINRWELEQWAGPMPQALQGPSADGSRNGGGDSRR